MSNVRHRQPLVHERRVKLRCGDCDFAYTFDPGTSQRTGEPGETHTCPLCGFTGTIAEDADE